jgi:hypothetical protein
MRFYWLGILWPWTLALVAIYCLVQVARDWRAGNYRMVVAGIFCLLFLALTPIPTIAYKLDLSAGK